MKLNRYLTGELYYIKSNGEEVLFKVKNENLPNTYNKGDILYTTETSPQLEVWQEYKDVKDGQLITFETKIDSIVRLSFTLKM